MTKKEPLRWYAHVYDEYYGYILCLQNKVLSYATTNHEGGYQKSKSYVCQSAPVRESCTQNRQHAKTVTVLSAGLNGDLYYFSIFIYRKKPHCIAAMWLL